MYTLRETGGKRPIPRRRAPALPNVPSISSQLKNQLIRFALISTNMTGRTCPMPCKYRRKAPYSRSGSVLAFSVSEEWSGEPADFGVHAQRSRTSAA